MKAVEVNSSIYFDFGKPNNEKYSKCEVDYHVRTSKYKSIFAKDYTSNWSAEAFVIKKLKILSVDICNRGP